MLYSFRFDFDIFRQTSMYFFYILQSPDNFMYCFDPGFSINGFENL